MARGPKKQWKPAKAAKRENEYEEIEVDDEIDAFHKQRDLVPLDVDDDTGDSDDDEEVPVFGIEESAEDDSDDNDNDDVRFNDKEIAKMKRQAKYMEQIVGGNEEMSDDAEPENESKVPWGGSKGIYYEGNGKGNESSDEEKSKAEESEARQMQKERLKFLRQEDLDLPSDSDLDQDESGSGQEKSFQGILDGTNTVAGTQFASLENIDVSALSTEERMKLVSSYAPELVPWLSELKDAHAQLEKVKPYLSKVGEMKDATRDGTHYLEVKHVLLLAYCQTISCYLLLNLEGHHIRDHPVKARILEIQKLFEQMKQIEVNLPTEIEELFNHSPADDIQEKLDRDTVLSEQEQDISPKLNEVPSVNKTVELTADHRGEFKSATDSQKHQDVLMSSQSKEMLKLRAKLEAKLKEKGLYKMTRPEPERNRNPALTSVNQRFETSKDFDDEVQHTSHDFNNAQTNLFLPAKISKLAAPKAKKRQFVSGDDDLPKRDDIGERRRKFELRVLAGAGAGPMDVNQEVRESQDRDDEEHDAEDGYYEMIENQRTEKRKAKEELYPSTSVFPPPLEAEADGKRNIGRQIEKNRGLTRHRKKETKTPRKNNRKKYEKQVKNRKGQVRDIKKPSGPYSGEQSGINAYVTHSIRF